ncbi:E3 ubiquitin-protein ligase bre1 [Dispira parvispora]|uniref:E3 ubiquitin protein ligase n=1 Tax=Dispira parvispora TaxID=1520584 RepID=A0A9W8AUA9_9FUNG|nr:E3 ubiquitin-protein ligase bre1 [Dispira parvispora]
MADKKRSSEESLTVSNASMPDDQQPPLKKRVTSTMDVHDPSTVHDDGHSPWGPDVLQQFKREAVFRKMREFQRENETLSSDLEHLQDQTSQQRLQLGWLSTGWDRLTQNLEQLSAVVQSVPVQEEPPSQSLLHWLLTSQPTSSISSEQEVPDPIRQRTDKIQSLTSSIAQAVNRLLDERRVWLDTHADDLISTEDKKRLAQQIYTEQQRLVTLLEHQAERRDAAESDTLSSKLELALRQSAELKHQLETTRQLLARSERKCDRLRSPATSHIFQDDIASSKPSPTQGEAPTETPTVTKSDTSPTVTTEALEEANRLSEARLRELEELREERATLRQERDQLILQWESLPDQRVADSSLYRHVLARKEFYQGEAQHLHDLLEKAQTELEDIKARRLQFQENVESEALARRKTLESQIKRLEGDATRLRANRDHYQQLHLAHSAKEGPELKASQEIRSLANSRKERIVALTNEVHRLRVKLAAHAGDAQAVEFYQTDEERSFTEGLQQRLEEAERNVVELTQQLEAYQSATQTEDQTTLQSSLVEAQRWQTRANELESELAKIRAKYQPSEETDTGEGQATDSTPLTQQQQQPVGSISSLLAKIEEYDNRVKQLELDCAAYKMGEQNINKELESISKSWDELHEQNTRRVLDIAKREDQIQQLQAERGRMLQKFNVLNKQRDQHSNLNFVLKRQLEKQQELLKALEDKEKLLTKQVQNLEKEVALNQGAVRVCKEKLVEFTLRNTELTDVVNKGEHRINDLQKMLGERNLAYEKEAHQTKRLMEENAQLKRRLERNSKEGAVDEELRNERDEYKTLLKCSSCLTRFKSHVLLRCMHVFCHECIQARLDTRQRKCPSCAEPFGTNDVRKIFL